MSRTETFEVEVPLPTAGSWQMHSCLGLLLGGDGQASLPNNCGMVNNAEYLAKAFALYCLALKAMRLAIEKKLRLGKARITPNTEASVESSLLAEYVRHFYKEIIVFLYWLQISV